MRRVLGRWGWHALLALLLVGAAAPAGIWLRVPIVSALAVVVVHAIRRRWLDVGVALASAGAIAAALVLATLRIDLGPAVRGYAEAAGSSFLKRPLRIDRLAIHLAAGRFELTGVQIDGLRPGDVPFLTARRITVAVPWWSVVTARHLLIDSVEMTGWRMTVEQFQDGRHNFPNVKPAPSKGPRRFRTTVRAIRALDGQFAYLQHGTWSTTAPGLDVEVLNVEGTYRGAFAFTGGRIQIQQYLPMRSDGQGEFRIDKGHVLLDRILWFTDGVRTEGTGDVDMSRWPEQTYRLASDVDLATAKHVFFTNEPWRVRGQARWTGFFHLFSGGRELKGRFTSALGHVNDYAFDRIDGWLVWTPTLFAVWDASSGFYGGEARYAYRIDSPPGARSHIRFDTSYQDVDLDAFTTASAWPMLRLLGRGTGYTRLEYPLGHWSERTGEGWMRAVPPPGVEVLRRNPLPEEEAAAPLEPTLGPPLDPRHHLRYVPIGGMVTYRLDPEWVTFDRSTLATPRTFVEFSGQTAYGDRSTIPFYARSTDWQESDDFLTSVMTAFGVPATTVPIGGRGGFTGVLLNAFSAPRIEGEFEGDYLRAWDVVWGRGRARVAVENSYADITGAVITQGDSEILVDGRFSLGYPRRDGGEEMNARIRATNRELRDLRHAFELDIYPLDGKVGGEWHLWGPYTGPYGFGRMTVDHAVAYDEAFETASASLRFEGTGVRLDAVRAVKGGGVVSGAFWVGWDGRYSFNVDGSGIPVESVYLLTYPAAPLSGTLQFSGGGAGTFLAPRYEIRGRIDDLFLKDEGVGQVTGRFGITDDLMNVDFEASSPRLAVSGTGRVALTPAADSDITLRFTDTSLDPYARAMVPGLSPFATVVASGTLRLVGQLAFPERLLVTATAERLDARLFDYRLHNDGPLVIHLDQQDLRFERAKLVGQDTSLELTGNVDLLDQRVAATVRGDANLAVLQLFLRDVRSSGRAELIAEVRGPLERPSVAGFAAVTGGRVRHLLLPHAIENINGRISFGSRGVWFDDVLAKVGVGEKPVRLGGRVELNGLSIGQLSVTATGEDVALRLGDGLRATVDADLALVGSMASPTLRGTLTVKDGRWQKRVDLSSGLVGLAAGLAARAAPAESPGAPGGLPLQYDLRVRAPSSLHVDSNVAQIDADADLSVRGTFERPLLFGRAEVERGQVFLEGKRYVVVPGSTIDFNNPTRIQPELNLTAETRVRAPGQVYMVTVSIVGTLEKLDFPLSSDPPLPQVDIVSLLFADPSAVQDVELRALQDPQLARREIALSAAARTGQILTAPLSSEVERAFGLDTFQIRPSLGIDPYQRINPSARLTMGKRISDRVYVTYSRSLATANRDEIILIEYDQNDRLAWVLSQNEDRTYALEFRVRHAF